MNDKIGDTTVVTYRLKEAAEAARLQEFASVDDAGNITSELALIRFLIEERGGKEFEPRQFANDDVIPFGSRP